MNERLDNFSNIFAKSGRGYEYEGTIRTPLRSNTTVILEWAKGGDVLVGEGPTHGKVNIYPMVRLDTITPPQ